MASTAFRAALAAAATLALVGETAAGGRTVACYEEVVRPAAYRTVEETVEVRPASTRTVVHPAVHAVRYRTVEIEPEQVIEKIIPAVVKTVHRKVLVQPAGTVWEYRKVHGKRILCEVKAKAVYRTVAETVVVKPERVKHVVIPARHGKVAETVVIEPERHETVTMPAEYAVVKRRVLVDEGGAEWRKIKTPKACRG